MLTKYFTCTTRLSKHHDNANCCQNITTPYCCQNITNITDRAASNHSQNILLVTTCIISNQPSSRVLAYHIPRPSIFINKHLQRESSIQNCSTLLYSSLTNSYIHLTMPRSRKQPMPRPAPSKPRNVQTAEPRGNS